jgi:hypothetical protein
MPKEIKPIFPDPGKLKKLKPRELELLQRVHAAGGDRKKRSQHIPIEVTTFLKPGEIWEKVREELTALKVNDLMLVIGEKKQHIFTVEVPFTHMNEEPQPESK